MKTPRDLEILQLVGRFGQLTTSQINRLIFHSNRSDSPCDGVLLRLYRGKFLARIGRTMVTVERGGSGEFVYSLGSKGWPYVFTGRYRIRQRIYEHTLDIGDAYIKLVEAERAGLLEITKVKVEPDAVKIGGQSLKPDMMVRYKVPGKGELSLFLEIDKATEHRGQMAAMFERYRQALLHFDDELPVFPLCVVLVACEPRKSQERVHELLRLLSRLRDDPARSIFRVETLDGFPQPWMLGHGD